MSLPRILLVEDNPGDADLALERLTGGGAPGFRIDHVTTLKAAVARLTEGAYDAVILDLHLPDSRGFETLRRVRAAAPGAAIIVASGLADGAWRAEAFREGAEEVIGKDEPTSSIFRRGVAYAIERAQVRDQHRQVEQIVEANPDAVLVVGLSGVVRYVNRAAIDLLGRPREDLVGHELGFPVTEGEVSEIRVARDGEEVIGEVRIAELEWKGEPARLASIRDVTARRQAQELRARSAELLETNRRVQEAADAAEAANRAKSAFLAHMTHEIRTPMNAVLGYTQLLQRDADLTPQQRDRLAVIARSGEHLLHLINDVLEMSKIEAGYRQIARTSVDLPGLIQDVTSLFVDRAREKGIALTIASDPFILPYIETDEGKLRQILVNLLGNAVKFTRRGHVAARFGTRPDPEGEMRLWVEIEDTGPGIAPSDLAGLFRPFVQGRAGVGTGGGTGLGLAISREFARMLGGDITAENLAGQGSVFRCEIAVAPGAPVPSIAAARRVIGLVGQARVLIVDDDADSRGWLGALLSQVGFEVSEAEGGAAAVAAFDAARPQLVMMDVNMPGMDGPAATRAIRERPGGRDVAILALSASVLDDGDAEMRKAGADDCLSKPCREDVLLGRIRDLTGVEYRYEDPAEPAPSLPRGPLPRGDTLPPPLRDALLRAAESADYERIAELIDAVPPEQAPLADHLRRLLDGFAYEAIADTLNSGAR